MPPAESAAPPSELPAAPTAPLVLPGLPEQSALEPLDSPELLLLGLPPFSGVVCARSSTVSRTDTRWTATISSTIRRRSNCLGWNHRGICHLAFHDAEDEFIEPTELRENWPNAKLQRDDSMARRQAKIIFTTDASASSPLRAFVRATPFRLRVWRALVFLFPPK